jgi:hypothetical protein
LWEGYFELLDRPYGLEIPAGGSVWHSISSTWDSSDLPYDLDQVSYEDNGDGVVSPGDRISGPTEGGGTPVVIVNLVGHVYHLDGDGLVLRPLSETGGSPVGETWLILKPGELWGTERHVDAWTPGPGGNGEPMDGDGVVLDGQSYVLTEVRLCVTAYFGVPVEPTTWGKLKQFLKDRF